MTAANDNAERAQVPRVGRCPVCGKPADNLKTQPFCSERCANVDLHRWLSGTYVIPEPEPDEQDDISDS